MNTTLSAPPGRRSTTVQPVAPARVGLVDRLALRLGVALVTWSRRPRRPERPRYTREQLVLLHEQRRDTARREARDQVRLLTTASHWRP